MHRIFRKRTLLVVALLVAATLVVGYRCRKILPLRAVLAAGQLTPQPIQYPGFPVAAATVDHWIASGNLAAMRTHGWKLWAGLAAVTPRTGGQPVFETWYSPSEVLAGSQGDSNSKSAALRRAGHAVHEFEVPEQIHHGRPRAVPAANASAAAVDVHDLTLIGKSFNTDYAQFVWKNNYQNPATIWALQAGWGTSPVSGRTIKPFTAPSISLKPTYEFVNGPNHNNGLTTVKYWLGDLTTGPTHSSNPALPEPTTWNQCVVVNTGRASNPGNLTCFGTNTVATGMVPVSQFYNYALTAAEAANVCSELGLSNPCAIQAGDYAILVGMHISTKENSTWTWQTLWWNYNQPFPYGAPPASVSAPFNNYAMCTGYSMTTDPVNSSKGTNSLCYNPYLETQLPAPLVGIASNCMSCHTVASTGNNPNSGDTDSGSPRNFFGYPTFIKGTANISVWNAADDKVFFDCQTTTDTSWFLANNAAAGAPGNQPPCVLTAVHKSPPPKK